MHTHIGISPEHRQSVAQELEKILADESVLYLKTKKAHWNVEGHDFYDKHKFFEAQFEEIDSLIDRIAERIRSLGHYAPATMSLYLNLTRLSETNMAKNNGLGFVQELLSDHETIILKLREQITPFAHTYADAGSSDFITGLMEIHEKMAYFLRSHMEEIHEQ